MGGGFPPPGVGSTPSEVVHSAFEKVGRKISFRRNDTLMAKGEEASEVFFLTEGFVDVILEPEPIGEAILVTYAEGEMVGELGALAGQKRSASVVARTGGRGIAVDRYTFSRLVSDPLVAQAMLKILANKLILTTQKMEVLQTKAAEARIAKALLFFHSFPHLNPPKLNQRYLEHYCGVSERHTRRIVSALHKRGCVEIQRKSREVVVKKPECLERMIQEAMRKRG